AGNLAVPPNADFTTARPHDTTPPAGSLTTPAANSAVSGTVTVAATAADNVGVVGVQFKLDDVNLGAEITLPPYNFTWNTVTVARSDEPRAAKARHSRGTPHSAQVRVNS